MAKFKSVKKICDFVSSSISNRCINDFVSEYKTWFRSYRFDNTPVAINYLKGLLSCPRVRPIWKEWKNKLKIVNTGLINISSVIRNGTTKVFKCKLHRIRLSF